jgi:hypothetical protein
VLGPDDRLKVWVQRIFDEIFSVFGVLDTRHQAKYVTCLTYFGW